MPKVVSIGPGHASPKALLMALLERDDIEWIAVCAMAKDGPIFEATNAITVEQLAYVTCGWSQVFGSLSGIVET